MTKRYEIYADVVFYSDARIKGKFIASYDAPNLLIALEYFDSLVEEKAKLLDAEDYLVNPMFISRDQSAISKKYYRDVASNSSSLLRWVF